MNTRKIIKLALIASAVTELLLSFAAVCLGTDGLGRMVFSIGHFPTIYLASQWSEVLEQSATTFFLFVYCGNWILLFLLYFGSLMIWKRVYGTGAIAQKDPL